MTCETCERNLHMWDIVINEQRYTPKVGDRVLDLGAWCGHFTFYCASRGARVRAYEPQTEVFEDLKHHLSKERWAQNVEVLNRAVWSKGAITGMYRNSIGDRSASLMNRRDERMPVCTDSLATALGDEWWNCVKVDIEGAEADVFGNADPYLLEQIRYLTMELHNDVLTRDQHDQLIDHLRSNFPKVETVEQEANGKGLGVICKLFCSRFK